jgi:hypothetical protein
MILYFEQMFEAFQDIRTNKHLAYVSVSHRKKNFSYFTEYFLHFLIKKSFLKQFSYQEKFLVIETSFFFLK